MTNNKLLLRFSLAKQYFRNPFKKENETYTGDRSLKDL